MKGCCPGKEETMFRLAKMGVGMTPPIKYRPAKAGEAIVLGEALADSTAGLTKCGATAKPDYVAVGPVNSDGEVPVIKVESYMEFETTLSVAAGEGGLSAGTKVTLSADGLEVTATTASGVAIITYTEGTAAGSAVGVRF